MDKDEELDLSFDTNTSFNLENNYCKIIFTANLLKRAEEKKDQINAKFAIQYDFMIDNLEDFFIK